MSQRQTERQVQGVIAELFLRLSLQIEQKETEKKIPQFLTRATWQLALENIVALMPQSGKPLKKAFQEQLLVEVPKLQKDTLMPKDLSEQKVRVSSPQRLSPRSSCSSARKSINLSKMNSIKLTDKLKSISVVEKKGSRREGSSKKQLWSELDIKLNEQVEEGQLQQLREKTEYRMQYLQEEAKLKQEREKYYQEKLKKFNETIADITPADVTFDYDGDPLRRTLMDQEMRLHKMRAGVGYSKRKLKDGFSKLNAPELSKIEVSKKQRQRGQSFRALRPLEIPTFYMKNIEGYEVKKMKMEQYKKKFGRGYSRLENQTLYTHSKEKTKEDLEVERHTLQEEGERVQSRQKFDGNRTTRKLALPRLHGKYKVLDRYEDN